MRHTLTVRGLCLAVWSCLALLWASCSVPDGVMLSIRAPEGVRLQSYIIKIQDRSTRKVVFLSGIQTLSEKRLLASDPLKVALPFSQHGRFLIQVLAANVPNVESLPQKGNPEPQYFFARMLDIASYQEFEAKLLPIPSEYDVDGDHFPDAVTWTAQNAEAAAMYQDQPEVLDCVDSDPAPGDLEPVRLRSFDIHPLATPSCNVKLRPSHPPSTLPPLELFDVTCAKEPRACEDKDGDGDPEGSDCDDTDKNRYHGNPRPRNCCECTDVTSCATNHKKRADLSLCQPKRCDTTFDFDCTGLNVDCFTDEDCDGYSPNNPDVKLRDCDDTDSRVHPNAQKLCDPADGVIKDWACDGRPQAGCVPCDLDGDGFQRSEVLAGQTCPTTNYKMSGRPLDCDDNDRGVFPGSATAAGTATKYGALDPASKGFNVLSAMRGLCRNTDSIGAIQNTSCEDPTLARAGCPSLSCDADGDGFPKNVVGCTVVGKPFDCNDSDPTAFPGAPIACDGKDHDCDNVADVCSFDRDKDGYDAASDCDDANADVHPFAVEMCNGRDDDCDGLIDELNPDSAGARMVQTGTDGSKKTTSCADSTVGLCGQKDGSGFFSGRCVCTSTVPSSTVDTKAFQGCPSQDNNALFTARCFGANQPKPQTCDALNPVDDDCNGSLDDPTGNNLKEKGQACGITVAGTRCKAGTVTGCVRTKDNPFYALSVPGFAQKDRYLVCKDQTDPIAELCNGLDDDCSGALPANEKDADGDKYMSCSGCKDTDNPAAFNTNLLYCNDCDDSNRNVWPAIPAPSMQARDGAPELCDSLDNKCVSGNVSMTPGNDGFEQCGNGADTGKGTCCPMLRMCIDPQTDFAHCGSCTGACSSSTADRCGGGQCMCNNEVACDPASQVKSLCKAGTGCVQCLAGADCLRILGSSTTTKACSATQNRCVECTDNGFCSAFPGRPACDTGTGKCAVCLSNMDCKTPTAPGCKVDPADSSKNMCVECTQNSHCTTPGKTTCDTTINKCVPCLIAADCKNMSPAQCKTDPDSTLNMCVECLTSNDCKTLTSRPICDATKNKCVPCLGDTDCPNTAPKCFKDVGGDTSKNLCVPCLSSTDCAGVAGKPVCDLVSHQCIACQGNPDCSGVAGKPACYINAADTTKNQCVPCVGTTDCPMATPTCKQNAADPSKNMCLICLADANCPATTPACYKDPGMDDTKNYCVECTSNVQCKAPSPKCYVDADPKKNACAACLANADCTNASTPKCYVDATDKHKNVCTACLMNADCNGTNKFCQTVNAMPVKNLCVPCAANADCKGATPKCYIDMADPTKTLCVECLMNADCPMSKPTCNMTTHACM